MKNKINPFTMFMMLFAFGAVVVTAHECGLASLKDSKNAFLIAGTFYLIYTAIYAIIDWPTNHDN